MLAQGFGVLCGVIGVRLNSHLIPAEILGVYGVFLTFAPIGSWVVHAGLVKFVARHWATSPNRPGLAREIAVAWARRLPWLALAGGAATVAMMRLSDRVRPTTGLVLVTAAALLALGALVQMALQAERAHWRDCVVAVSGSLSRTFGPPLLFLASGGAIAALWLGFCGHALVVAAVGVASMHAYWRASGTAGNDRQLTAVYEGPLFIALAVAEWAVAGLNRWLVAWFFGETEAGYFTLAGGAAVVLASTLGTVFMQYFQPGFFALGDSPTASRHLLARRVDLVALAYALTGLAAVGAFQLAAPWLVGSLISPEYRAALKWILPSGCFTVSTLTAVFFHSLLLAGRRERACGPVNLITAGALAIGCVTTAAAGPAWFTGWLFATPLVPWLLTRTLARSYFFKPAAPAGPGPAP